MQSNSTKDTDWHDSRKFNYDTSGWSEKKKAHYLVRVKNREIMRDSAVADGHTYLHCCNVCGGDVENGGDEYGNVVLYHCWLTIEGSREKATKRWNELNPVAVCTWGLK